MAENNPRGNNASTAPMSISSMKLFGLGGAGKRMSVDEGMGQSPPTYGSSPLSSMLSSSPGGSSWGSPPSSSSSGNPPMCNQGRRDSLKYLWHLQDFGTD